MYQLFFDGSSKGKPGPAAAGFAVYQQGVLVDSKVLPLPEITNNQAEYLGLLMALEWIQAHNVVTAVIKGDSQLVVRQMQGIYKVKNDLLKALHKEARAFAAGRLLRFEWIPREENAYVDDLVQQAAEHTNKGL